MRKEEIARLIDHTLLKPEATPAQVETICEEAKHHHFASVCINPFHVERVARALDGTDVATCTVVGFPLGATLTAVKVFEAQQALNAGADEIDMVLNIGALKGQAYDFVQEDIAAVAEVCHPQGGILKVILETALLSDEEKVVACRRAQAAGADFVKTSTGFSTAGATLEDVRLMRQTVGPDMGIKAAGGIRSYADALAMVEAGATRIGASAGVKIVTQAPE
jgi:deoxyribose-phosphate aldolase